MRRGDTAVRGWAGKVGVVAVAAALLGWAGTALFAGSLGDVFQRVSPSVVIVHTLQSEPAPGRRDRTVAVVGQGSGVLVSERGRVLTAAHVVQAVDTVQVEFKGGESVRARVVGSDPVADLALLQLDRVPAGAVVARLGDSDSVAVGDQVFVVGAPYGLGHTLTVGHVSGRHRSAEALVGFVAGEYLQTDAAINPGNSGGPLFDTSGRVVGIVSQILSRSGGFEGVGLAVASNSARRLMLDEGPP